MAWLTEVVQQLGLASAEVIRARAEDVDLGGRAAAVTARAVAPMDRLARWTLPLLKVGGQLLAMKGSRAQEEIDAASAQIRLGGGMAEVVRVTSIPQVTPTTVVRVIKERDVIPPAPPHRRGRRAGRPRA